MNESHFNQPKRLPFVNIGTATYENISVDCPDKNCRKRNIFNRASDPKKLLDFDRAEVICQHCGKKFAMGCDTINEKYEYFILDCYEIKEQKRYMYCIINLCQACEAFFLKGIEVKLLWQPKEKDVFGKKGEVYEHNFDKQNNKTRYYMWYDIFNLYADRLRNKVKNYTYSWLRNVFFDLYLNNKLFRSQKEIEEYIKVMDCYANVEPQDKELKEKCNGELQDLFIQLKKLKINEIRNEVVHKKGYRPTLEQVDKYLEEVRSIIFGLREELNIKPLIMYI